MKKLMFAAMAMASAAAMAGTICDPDPSEASLGCRAYDFKASVKLVDGKTATIKAGSICSADEVGYYRVAATRKLKGVFTDCNVCQSTNGTVNAAQSSFFAGEENGGAIMYMATSANKYKKVFTSQIYNGGTLVDPYWFNILNVFGGNTWNKSKKVEALIQLEFVERDQYNEERAYYLVLAGFGARDGAVIKNLSGNLAGAVTAANWCGLATQVWEPCIQTPYWTPTTGGQTVKDNWENGTGTNWTTAQTTATADKSPAYDAVSGTWSLKYNASKSKLQTNSALMKKTFASDYEFFTPITGTAAVYPVVAPFFLQ